MISVSSSQDTVTSSPDLAPLLDIIFIVMVFLLLTANITIETMQVDIPTTADSEVLQTPAADALAINILASAPYWAIKKQSYADWPSFSQALLKQHNNNQQQPLVIGVDKNAPVERMLKLLAFLQKNNINATSIIMEEESL